MTRSVVVIIQDGKYLGGQFRGYYLEWTRHQDATPDYLRVSQLMAGVLKL